jgi:RNA polymerase sigma-70 factor, ECF subfamily
MNKPIENLGRRPKETGDPKASLADLYEAHAPRLYRYALMILADPSTAEDVCHQVFTKLLKMSHQILQIQSCEHYLTTAVRNECYRTLQDRREGRMNIDTIEPFLEPIAPAQPGHDEKEAVEKALRVLPPDQREVVHLKVYEDLTFSEISDRLDISLNTAASRYRYAMEKLRVLLGKKEGARYES